MREYVNINNLPIQRKMTTGPRIFIESSSEKSSDEDLDPVGSVDFWAAGSGSVTFFTG